MNSTVFTDGHNRQIGSVRISVVDRCNLRCTYCMPEEGVKWLDRDEILSYEEIMELVRLFYSYSVRKFRLTGGEPTVRKDIVSLVKMIKEEFPDTDLSMTTNGINLGSMAEPLREVGLDRINISLDTLDHDKFSSITRRDGLEKVIEGIKTAVSVGFEPVKINAVSIKSFNDDLESIQKFIELSEKYGVEVRFIELMPFSGNNWTENGFIGSQELRSKIKEYLRLEQLPVRDPASTSTSWMVGDKGAKIGFISSVTESFCDSCNRVRITADGKFRPCLHNSREYDLKQALRKGERKEMIKIIKRGLEEKWKEHPDFLSLSYDPPVDDREMIRIGG